MPSNRRLRIILISVVLAGLVLLYLGSSTSASDKAFYDRTVEALNLKHQSSTQSSEHVVDASGKKVGDAVLKKEAERIKAEVQEAADARRKGEKEGKEEGEKKMEKEKGVEEVAEKAQKVIAGEGGKDGKGGDAKEEGRPGKTGKPHDVSKGGQGWGSGKDEKGVEKEAEKEKSPEERKVENDLTGILKRSPIIIFSKSYCPYSKKAKAVFAKYKIVPAPFIVELDLEEGGRELQAKLFDMTGRKTVPNVLISGKSIGGGDDVESLHETGKLIETVKSMGGKRIMEAELAT